MKTFAVGDLHGRFDLLSEVVARVHSLSQDEPARIIYLGDYIDRGPQSREVIEMLRAGPTRSGDEWICLKGNHEEMMVQAEYGTDFIWDRNGGAQTKASFGGIVPKDVLAWCDALPIFWESDHHYFVHAGIEPFRPLELQGHDHQLWIRRPFLIVTEPHPKYIIHGHTIVDGDPLYTGPKHPTQIEPCVLDNRCNLDTGSFWSRRVGLAEFDLAKPGKPIHVETVWA